MDISIYIYILGCFSCPFFSDCLETMFKYAPRPVIKKKKVILKICTPATLGLKITCVFQWAKKLNWSVLPRSLKLRPYKILLI